MRQGPHPLRYLVLILPYGACFGYVSVALNYVATNRLGIAPDEFAKVIAAAFFVHGIKLFWAPVVDTTLKKRVWYLIALALAIAGVMVSALMPISRSTLGQLTLVVMASQIGLTLMGMACETLLGALPDHEKGRAAGFYQAGNFLGLGLGGGLATTLFDIFPERWMAAGVLCALMLPCGFALIGVPEPKKSTHGLWETLVKLLRDLRALVVEKVNGKWVLAVVGLSGLFIAFSPVGSGAAGNLFPSISKHWGASAWAVAAVNGWLGGIVGAGGALAGGWLADRVRRRTAYAIAGALTALTGLAFGFAPLVPGVYVGGVLLYTFCNGMAFGAFSAFVLETIGHGAVATKYNIFASLANLAITYMTTVDGAAYKRYEQRGMFVVDAACTFGGIAILLVLTRTVQWIGRRRSPEPADPVDPILS